MFERFTDRSRRVVVLAQEEARMLGHNHIGTEHLLLGLLREQSGGAAEVLASAGVTLDAARAQVAEIAVPGDKAPAGHIPFTPRAKRILELSLREALELNQGSIRPEHVLLGLIRERKGVGAQVLGRLGNIERRLGIAAAAPAFTGFRGLLASVDRHLTNIERHLGVRQEPEGPRREGEAAAGDDSGPAPGE
jgi:ATP-dependent Clp protease ATP-binding subunit ClpC